MGGGSYLCFGWIVSVAFGLGKVRLGMRCALSSSRGSPERLRSVGMDGPKMSVSRIPVLIPWRANERARFTVVFFIELAC